MQTILVGEAVCRGQRIEYDLLAEETESGCGQYGVRIVYGGEESAIPRVTESQRAALDLIHRLIRGTVTPVSLRDVVEDWLLS